MERGTSQSFVPRGSKVVPDCMCVAHQVTFRPYLVHDLIAHAAVSGGGVNAAKCLTPGSKGQLIGDHQKLGRVSGNGPFNVKISSGWTFRAGYL